MIFKLISYLIVIFVIVVCVSCSIDSEVDEDLLPSVIVFNTDGTGHYKFPQMIDGYDCNYGNLTEMHDNRRYLLSNENVFMYDYYDHSVTPLLTDIEINYRRGEYKPNISLSYDDNYITFKNVYDVYCFEISANEYWQVTEADTAYVPRFGSDNKIYYSRRYRNDNKCILKSVNIDGSDMEEICEVSGWINEIFPGQTDSGVVFIQTNEPQLCRVEVSTGEVTVLFETQDKEYISRTSDDRYFCYGDMAWTHKLYDTEDEITQTYIYPMVGKNCVSRIFHHKKEALVFIGSDESRIKFWDIDNNIQIGESLYIPDLVDWIYKSEIAISYDGNTAAILD